MAKILVADDSIAVRKVAERLLTEAGLGVTLAANGEEALAYLAKEQPDVIVSDVIMPDKSGYEVCAFVRGNAALAETPVLLISGIVNEEVTRQAESCRANGVLKKPFQGTSLKDRVFELIAKRQVQVAPPVHTVQPESTGAPIDSGGAPWITPERLAAYQEAVAQAQQVDAQLSAERDRAEQLARRVAELEAVAGRVQELEGAMEGGRQQAAELRALSERAASLEAALLQAQQQIANLEGQVATGEHAQARVQEVEAALLQAQQQAANLEGQVAAGEQAQARVQELQSALQHEQTAVVQYRKQLAEFQKTTAKVVELEAALYAEREAAAQLVEQLTILEKSAARQKELETRLAREEHRAADYEQQANAAETALTTERARVGELSARLATAERSIARVAELEHIVAELNQKVSAGVAKYQELEKAAAKAQEVEGLLSTERDRNGLLTRRVAEAEHATEQATKRFEDMARKLGEIAGLASQLGHTKGRS